MQRIIAAVQADDAEALVAEAHKLKGGARTLGAESLAAICLELEQAGKEGRMASDELEAALVALKRAAERLHERLGQMVEAA